MTIAYRPAQIADAAAIDRVFRQSFCDTFGHLYGPEDLASFLGGFTPDKWKGEIADAGFAFRVAEDAGECIGYIKLGPLSLPVEPGGAAIELRQFYLLHAYTGQGIAAELMEWAIGVARERGAREIYLSVFTENHRARRFYERYGFDYVAPYTFMVGNHADDDIIMRLTL
ncbi:GNAT family N-acetyltransferase [Sphingomonas sinipercae]|uniref:GNAT family N-acetyltransferase n=1 Tax=Sphingomonas sinipercae TaxID=2714944 RepID=A0A6G7ZLG4_9SPHN|nr:GNAT family N-acetyltransferase [Sphingomonas sinipercae]QIL01765.1 GNAT family N-acetyltransferase [Sphingomonas sinipercae]